MSEERRAPGRRAEYRHFLAIPTRWGDNDPYRHVNNIQYYGFFDTVVNKHLLDAGFLDFDHSPVVGFVVENQCRFYKSIAFPDMVHAGMRVARLGRSSVRYEIGIFRNDDDDAAAEGYFIHAYVDRAAGKSAPIPDAVRALLAPLAA